MEAVAFPDELWLCVSDDGPGFRTSRPQDLFRKFERGARESATPGVGLGLALCRAIVEAHGGEIRAETAASGGARFVMVFARNAPPDVSIEESLYPRSFEP
jgi:two-component system sensor histidine kinase KdpD